MWLSPDAKAQERHHFYCLQSMLVSLRETHIPSKISTFSDSESYGTSSISNNSYPPYPNTTRRLLWTIRCTGASIHKWFPTSLSPHRCRPKLDLWGRKKLGRAWHLRQLRWSFQTPRERALCDGMGMLIGRIGM